MTLNKNAPWKGQTSVGKTRIIGPSICIGVRNTLSMEISGESEKSTPFKI